MTAFLGVESSLTKRRWIGLNSQQDRLAQEISQLCNLPDALARTLARLGVGAEQVPQYLQPSLKELMPDPSTLKDMDIACHRLVQAVAGKQRIAIFADYDVDGAASCALLVQWLKALGLTATIYVPDRIEEGYGPNEQAMTMLAKNHDLIICVDCGTLSYDAIAAVQNTDVIVLDHHIGGEELPVALAVVNPNRQDEDTPLSELCAAGVVFMVLVAANRLLRQNNANPPKLLPLLDLVALATVADVAPLQGLNRAFVRQGLKIMGKTQRAGLNALAVVARQNKAPDIYTLGFVFGPRINAGGRIGQADLGARLLSTTDPHEAAALAERLDQLNAERRAIEAQVRLQALEQAESRDTGAALVWAASDGWHPGVVGIAAARLKEATNRPAIVIGFDGDIGKGSGRSVNGIDIGAAIATCTREGLLQQGGGHKMAAGLTVQRRKLDAAMARLTELLSQQGADKIGPADVLIDGALTPAGISTDLLGQLETAGPFGAGAPAPRFALPDVSIAFSRKVGDNHLQLTFKDDDNNRIDAIAFGAYGSEIGPVLGADNGQRYHVVGRLTLDDWQGRNKVKLRLEDAARL